MLRHKRSLPKRAPRPNPKRLKMPNEGYIFFKSKAPKRRIAKAQTSKEMLKERMESDPRTDAIRRGGTREECARIGIDALTRDLISDQVRSGSIPCETDARAEAQAVAERVERKKDE